MNATKRKFQTLLQGISARSPTADTDKPEPWRPSTSSVASSSSTSMAFDSELLAKRRRLGLSATPSAGNSASTLSAGGKPATGFSNVVLKKWDPEGNNQKKSTDAPRYSPGDRGELLKRLATFQELTDWAPKPERVSEVEWAKRGWICVGKERVRCTLCHKEVVVGVNRKEVDGKEVSVLVPSEIEDALVEKYVELIVRSHQEDCLWRKRGCDDSLLRLSLTNAKASLEALRQRYDELVQRKSFLPYEFNLRLPEGLDLDAVISQLPADFFTKPSSTEATPKPQDPPNRVALALGLLGWQGLTNARIGAVPNSASCQTCLRRLGLWMFKSKQVSPAGEVLVPAPMDHLDPVREHRFFCPWKNAAAQRLGSARPNATADEDLPGWKVLTQAIKNEAYLREALDGRPKSRATRPKTRDGAATPATTPGTPGLDGPLVVIGPDGGQEDDEKTRDAKDKERWARLRRVKSLFDTKAGKKLRRPLSRPGTGHSTASVAGSANLAPDGASATPAPAEA